MSKAKVDNFEISCWFKNDRFMVSISRDRKGVIRMRPWTSYGHGEGHDVCLNPQDLEFFHQFLKESRDTFNKIYTVNQDLLKENT